ncbi:aldose epimerase family protein [Marinimicrobium sp. ARAG 43.8]|uniref:aldose epimerase family protein n=1 Tax=Marinimicrobium sp. ARAG 43.8 TaxID=3418719 RepID=UPI003CEE28C5
MPVLITPFGTLPDGRPVSQCVLTNPAGMEVRLLNYGGIITHLFAPDRHGELADVVLGFDELAPYFTDSPYFGAIIGRFGNRIAKGSFSLGGETFQLDQNDGENHIHGGVEGFDKKLWEMEALDNGDDAGVRLTLISPDGDQGYPGELRVQVDYRLTPDNRLVTEYQATTTRATPVNLTQHSYFNLAAQGNVLEHILELNASQFTPVNEGLIPEGDLTNVQGTPFDFTKPQRLGAGIGEAHPQLQRVNGGYDHNFVIDRDKPNAGEEVFAARAHEPHSGRVLEVWTTEPCFQLYTSNFLDGTVVGKKQRQVRHGAFCIEPQHFPDSPNQSRFPSTILQPGERYYSRMSFRFSAQ